MWGTTVIRSKAAQVAIEGGLRDVEVPHQRANGCPLLALHLLQSAVFHVNTVLIQQVLVEPVWPMTTIRVKTGHVRLSRDETGQAWSGRWATRCALDRRHPR